MISYLTLLIAKFQTGYGDFIRKSYEFCNSRFEQVLPQTDTVLEKLNFIKYALFTNEYNKWDRKIQDVEKIIENYFQKTSSQNNELYKFTKQKYQYRSGVDPEVLTYPILAGLVKNFEAYFGNAVIRKTQASPTKQSVQSAQNEGAASRKLLKSAVTSLTVEIFRVTLHQDAAKETAINLVFGSEKLTKKDFNPLAVGLEGVFTSKDLKEDFAREISIELHDIRDAQHPRKTKSVTVNLKSLPVNVVTKINLKLNETDPDVYGEDYVSTEVEVGILLETADINDEAYRSNQKEKEPLIIPELEEVSLL